MMNKRSITPILTFFSAFFIVALVQAEGVSTKSSGGDHPSKKLYDSKCSSCHGKDLKGSKTMAKAFKVDPSALDLIDEPTLKKTDEELMQLTAKGVGKMPAYEKSLKPADMVGLVQYLRSVTSSKKIDVK
jgi:mono/diheme cytochrome c family protein